MNLVCICGIDGGGKTTLAHTVVRDLRQSGVSAVYLYGRTYPVVSRILMFAGRATFLRRQNIWKAYPDYANNKKQVMRAPWLAALYTSAIYFDYYLQIWLKLLPHLFSRVTIVTDRYVYDTVISDLAVHLSYSISQTELAIKRNLIFLPKPALTLVIDLPEEVAFSRKTDVPHVEYLKERRGFYQALCGCAKIECLNGELPPEVLATQVVTKIKMLSGMDKVTQ